jgi:hypothetical protein
MQINKAIEEIDATHIRMVVEVMDEERVRSRRTYNITKSPTQDTEAVCRVACPEAFAEVFTEATAS